MLREKIFLDKVKVSYIVTSYNHSRYIERCLDSIKRDMDGYSEVVVVDDGSSDGSDSVIMNWFLKQENLQYRFLRTENRGVSATFNSAIELAQGEFLRGTASDDEIILGSTSQLLQHLEGRNDIKFVFGDVKVIDQDSALIAESYLEYLGKQMDLYTEDIKKAVISQWGIAGPSWFARKEFVEVVGKFDESIIIEDWNMFLKLVSAGIAKFVPQEVGLYRIHGTNTSRTKDKTKRINNLKSQMIAGKKSLALFEGGYKRLLEAEVHLLNAKISYLQGRLLAVLRDLTAYLIKKYI